jgi:SagB-type dehydrogenase family enzyme
MTMDISRREWLSRSFHSLFLTIFFTLLSSSKVWARLFSQKKKGGKGMPLPPHKQKGTVSVEEAIQDRRTVRDFSPKAIHLHHLSQCLWSGQGITEENGYKRAAPSAGALYPLDLYAVVGSGGIEGLEPGVYQYDPKRHALLQMMKGDKREDLALASLRQMWMSRAPVTFIITAEYRRITGKYDKRGIRYAHIESGHLGQNIFLQAGALGLVCGIVGAFDDGRVIKAAGLPLSHEPLLLMPLGYRA